MALLADQKRKFLLVFTDPITRKTAQTRISAQIPNSIFITAQDGLEAIQKINNDPPHVVVAEGTLSKHSGHQVARMILGNKNLLQTAMIIVAPIPDQESFVDEVVMGRIQFIEKLESDHFLGRALTKTLNYCSHGDKAEFYLRFLSDGDQLIRQGDRADFVYIVKQGQLRADLNANGGKSTLGFIEVGEFVGEMAYINGEPRMADVVATTNCELIEIPIDHLDHLLFTKPAWSRALLKTLSKRVKRAAGHTADG